MWVMEINIFLIEKIVYIDSDDRIFIGPETLHVRIVWFCKIKEIKFSSFRQGFCGLQERMKFLFSLIIIVRKGILIFNRNYSF